MDSHDLPAAAPEGALRSARLRHGVETLVGDLVLLRELAFRQGLLRTARGAEALLVTLMGEVTAVSSVAAVPADA